MANVGLLFGSFNPVHIGHLALANYMLAFHGLDEVWLVVSPQNPFKSQTELISSHHRFSMLNLALANNVHYKACDVELHMPLPSYTIDTLSRLETLHPTHTFRIIMGADNLPMIERWKEADNIFLKHQTLVYPRQNCAIPVTRYDSNISVTKAPLFELSSTQIRQMVANGQNIDFWVPAGVAGYIHQHRLYKPE
jgi:nicotinate-nucleotide adenylyltransferase